MKSFDIEINQSLSAGLANIQAHTSAISETETVRNAIKIASYICTHLQEGAEIYVKDCQGNITILSLIK